jgi:Na+-transporting NADH:ubiquinone oxidoreductase subunit A
VKAKPVEYFSLKPSDFLGITPKLVVEEGDEVLAGDAVFYCKENENIKGTAPVSGIVHKIVRGERRKLENIIIHYNGKEEYKNFGKINPEDATKEDIKVILQESGLWLSIKERPYNIVVTEDKEPRDIFISAFDTSPLAPDIDFLVSEFSKEFSTGIAALKKFTNGSIHVNVNGEYNVSPVYSSCKDITINNFTGPHPSGCVGVQINHISPINKGETVWTIDPQHVIMIGRLFLKGHIDMTKLIALTGSEVKMRKYIKTISGTTVERFLEDNIEHENIRVISGNPLTGKKIDKSGYLGFFDHQVTVIPEGDYYRFMGWAAPGLNRFSKSRAFFSWLMPFKKYRHDTNLNGGERAFVFTGVYEDVLPMDILPMQLFKAIITEDIDQMEALGIYEIVEEDVALCEYVCPSKMELQELIRKGIDLMIKETT